MTQKQQGDQMAMLLYAIVLFGLNDTARKAALCAVRRWSWSQYGVTLDRLIEGGEDG